MRGFYAWILCVDFMRGFYAWILCVTLNNFKCTLNLLLASVLVFCVHILASVLVTLIPLLLMRNAILGDNLKIISRSTTVMFVVSNVVGVAMQMKTFQKIDFIGLLETNI